MISPENVHANKILQTEQVGFIYLGVWGGQQKFLQKAVNFDRRVWDKKRKDGSTLMSKQS